MKIDESIRVTLAYISGLSLVIYNTIKDIAMYNNISINDAIELYVDTSLKIKNTSKRNETISFLRKIIELHEKH